MTEIQIEKLMVASPEAAQQLDELMRQLTVNGQKLDVARLQRIIEASGQLYVAKSDGVIVGSVYRVDMHHPVRSKCWMEDLVVDENFRGRGIARQLMETAIAEAPPEMVSVSLNSNIARVQSHKLYLKLGFELREDTRIWLLKLPR